MYNNQLGCSVGHLINLKTIVNEVFGFHCKIYFYTFLMLSKGIHKSRSVFRVEMII